jgi:hypothetical protein
MPIKISDTTVDREIAGLLVGIKLRKIPLPTSKIIIVAMSNNEFPNLCLLVIDHLPSCTIKLYIIRKKWPPVPSAFY